MATVDGKTVLVGEQYKAPLCPLSREGGEVLGESSREEVGPRQGQSQEAWEGGKHAGPVLGPGVFSSWWEEITYCPPERVFAVREVTAFPWPDLAKFPHLGSWPGLDCGGSCILWVQGRGAPTSSLLGLPIYILLPPDPCVPVTHPCT